jgi:hypothetical protein
MVTVPNRIFIDLGPLRESRGFRLLFAGEFVEVFGSQLTAPTWLKLVRKAAAGRFECACRTVGTWWLMPYRTRMLEGTP